MSAPADKKRTSLRTGFSTGSAAAAAAKAALLVWQGSPAPAEVDIPLPAGGRIRIPVSRLERLGGSIRASVVKDAGDDPDVTHKAVIQATLSRLADSTEPDIVIRGGAGVGQVTKPGLPVPVGDSAINPVPRSQIRQACLEALGPVGQTGHYEVLIEVPEGERLARKTMNPRLGVIGGISILGTRGTVLPFSSASYKGTIESELDVAKAAGCLTVGLATGGRSERFLRGQLTALPEDCFILTADYFAFSLEQAAVRGFQGILLGCFFGKLVKMAQGHPYTHARSAALDFSMLAGWAEGLGLEAAGVRRIEEANTARECLEVIRVSDRRQAILEGVAGRAALAARGFAGAAPELEIYLFDFSGELLTRTTGDGGRP